MPEPLVLVPGLACDARLFWHQVIALSGERPVMVAAPLSGVTVEEMGAALLDGLPERFALAGAGLGANVAVDILRRIPERVTRLALIGVSAQPETPIAAAAREPRIVGAQAGRLGEVIADEVPLAALADGSARREIMGMLRDMALTLGEGVFVRQSRAMQRRPDQQRFLRRALLPAVTICGAEDPLTPPRRHQFIAELMPYGTYEEIPHAGHLPTLEQPEATTAALERWLSAPLMLR